MNLAPGKFSATVSAIGGPKGS